MPSAVKHAPPPLRELLDDPQVGTSTPASMCAIRGILRGLARRRDLPPAVTAAIRVIYDAADLACQIAIGEAIEGSTSINETRSRIEQVAYRMDSDVTICTEGDRRHEALDRRAARMASPRIATRLGAAWLHLWGIAPDEEPGLIAPFVHDFLNGEAPAYSTATSDRRQTLVDRICDALVPHLGRRPMPDQVQAVMEGLANRSKRGVKLWEPLAELVRPGGSPLSGEAIRKAVQRAKR